MRASYFFLTIIPLVLLTACSSTKPRQETQQLQPVSYRTSMDPSTRGVGLLRRLVVAPIQFDYIKDGKHWEEKEQSIKKQWREQIRALLQDQRGYEVELLDIYEDMYPEKLGLTAEEVSTYCRSLAAWALKSSDGEKPPESVAEMAGKLGRPLNVDGILLIQGINNPSGTALNVLTVATIFATAPFAIANSKFYLEADVIEIATGRVVWRNRHQEHQILFEDEPRWLSLYGSMILKPIEPAIPRALTK
jgi:hypothetical protein